MDMIFSTRMDESVVYLVDSLSKKLGLTKKKLLEEAVRDYAKKTGEGGAVDVFTETSGSWKRSENPGDLRDSIKRKFGESMKRRHK